jgi:hypothetical protein
MFIDVIYKQPLSALKLVLICFSASRVSKMSNVLEELNRELLSELYDLKKQLK